MSDIVGYLTNQYFSNSVSRCFVKQSFVSQKLVMLYFAHQGYFLLFIDKNCVTLLLAFLV